MKVVLRLVLIAALAAFGAWLWFVLFPSPETIVRKQLAALARTASFAPGEGNLAKLAAADKLAGFFATNVEVNIDVPGHLDHNFVGRDEIQQAALGARESLASLKITFPDLNVTVAPDKQSAVVDVTVVANAAGQSDSFVQQMKFTFQKTEDGWLISRVETVRTLS
ncbi:MAG: hypothetical protein ABSE16_07610 [Verrucomicrobiota bacterium]|jgi:hypothetical protein